MARDRRRGEHRCATCRLHRSLCVCGLEPRLQTRTRVILIVHQLEQRKPTNTGLLAARCLPGCRVVVRGPEPPASVAATWSAATNPVLLFPAADAAPIELWRGLDLPVTLVVPDGTWAQAARARRRLPGLDRLPCAAVPVESGSRYRLREGGRPERLSTIEALARALGVLEGPEVQRALERIFRIAVERALWAGGRLPAAEVTGGIPPGARPHDPLGTAPGRR